MGVENTHKRGFALLPTTELCVGGVLHVHDPASHKHRQPGEEQVLHTQVGSANLAGGKDMLATPHEDDYLADLIVIRHYHEK